MAKVIKHDKLTETLSITECGDGFWLYDETRSMNLSMRAKSPQDAFVEALGYYQRRLAEVEASHKSLDSRVQEFVSQFVEEDERPY